MTTQTVVGNGISEPSTVVFPLNIGMAMAAENPCLGWVLQIDVCLTATRLLVQGGPLAVIIWVLHLFQAM